MHVAAGAEAVLLMERVRRLTRGGARRSAAGERQRNQKCYDPAAPIHCFVSASDLTEAGARHRRQPRAVRRRRGDRAGHADDRGPVLGRRAPEPPQGAGVAQEDADRGRDNRPAGRRARAIAPRPLRAAAQRRLPAPGSRLTPLIVQPTGLPEWKQDLARLRGHLARSRGHLARSRGRPSGRH